MTAAWFWRDSAHEIVEEAIVTFEVAGHQFGHGVVHLWVDSDTHPGVTFDLTKSEAVLLGVALMKEGTK